MQQLNSGKVQLSSQELPCLIQSPLVPQEQHASKTGVLVTLSSAPLRFGVNIIRRSKLISEATAYTTALLIKQEYLTERRRPLSLPLALELWFRDFIQKEEKGHKNIQLSQKELTLFEFVCG